MWFGRLAAQGSQLDDRGMVCSRCAGGLTLSLACAMSITRLLLPLKQIAMSRPENAPQEDVRATLRDTVNQLNVHFVELCRTTTTRTLAR